MKPIREAVRGRTIFTAALALGALFVVPFQSARGASAPLHALVVGGGPDFDHNQAAIESNVRYVTRLLPPGATERILFADGSRQTKDVLCLDKNGNEYYRTPMLPVIDGPTRLLPFQHEVETAAPVAGDNPASLLLYFTGHGSPNRESNFENNQYDMWNADALNVQRLASDIDALPASLPVTVIMVQCFSGAFGNLLFQNGDPKAPLTNRDICGFFASISQRPAAGCTPEVNEANYRDFTGYFFAALTGTDRLGHHVGDADYNHDGRVGMDEAFAYTLIHDHSIDTPVCTSDVFLRRFVKDTDEQVFKTSYAQVRAWASPAQRTALDSLSKTLMFRDDARLPKAFAAMKGMEVESDDPEDIATIRFARLAKSVVLAHSLSISSDKEIKDRYAALLASEARNPLRPEPKKLT